MFIFAVRSRSASRKPRMRRRQRRQRWPSPRSHRARAPCRRVPRAPSLVVAVESVESWLHHRDRVLLPSVVSYPIIDLCQVTPAVLNFNLYCEVESITFWIVSPSLFLMVLMAVVSLHVFLLPPAPKGWNPITHKQPFPLNKLPCLVLVLW